MRMETLNNKVTVYSWQFIFTFVLTIRYFESEHYKTVSLCSRAITPCAFLWDGFTFPGLKLVIRKMWMYL